MSVTSLGTLRGIEFHFNDEDVPAANRRVGRCKSSEYATIMHFDIDGPGGEFITAIEMYIRYFAGENVMWFYKEGQVESFKARISDFEYDISHARANNSDLDESWKMLPFQREESGCEYSACEKAHHSCCRIYHYWILLESALGAISDMIERPVIM
ncbi:hypothetical protein J3459_002499 [Metarhizium acridum]|nr:hypothetical protein J3459_002499 [Metarhizium acridum]